MSVRIRREDLETRADRLLDESLSGVGPGDVVVIKGAGRVVDLGASR